MLCCGIILWNRDTFALFLHQSITFSGFHCFHFKCVLFLVISFSNPPSKIRPGIIINKNFNKTFMPICTHPASLRGNAGPVFQGLIVQFIHLSIFSAKISVLISKVSCATTSISHLFFLLRIVTGPLPYGTVVVFHFWERLAPKIFQNKICILLINKLN